MQVRDLLHKLPVTRSVNERSQLNISDLEELRVAIQRICVCIQTCIFVFIDSLLSDSS